MRDDRRCLVVGGGLLGLSAACALARRGWSVEVLEAGQTIGHDRSGSKGDARIFRLGYRQSAYVTMALHAGELWRQLEQASGRVLLHPTGQLSLGDPTSLGAVATALEAHHARYEELSASEVRARFPAIADHGPALFEPSSGVLAADECLRALRAVGGFTVRTGVPVTAIDQDGITVQVHTACDDTLTADVVVDCAGPATLGLLGRTLDTGVVTPPSMPQVAYFRSAAPGHDLPPVFIEWGDDMIYGLPVPAAALDDDRPRGSGRLYKVSHHTPGPLLSGYDPTDGALLPDDPALLASLTDAARRLLPTLDPLPVRTERCVYDNTADGDFVVDRVGRVVVGCGTSGHGFKFGPLLGEALADLAEGAASRIDLAAFRLDRNLPGAPDDGRPNAR